VADGVLIGRDFTTFTESRSGEEGSYLAYSFGGRPVSYPLPACFGKNKKPLAVALSTEGEGEALSNAYQIDGDKIILILPPMIPVKITT
jgi:hypothetical protein